MSQKTKQRVSEKSIAELPFANRSAENNYEYFSDGITEEIINGLTKIDGLKVTSRTSSFFFKNKSIPLKQIAAQLNVDIILEGSVRIADNNLRVSAQLIEAEKDFHFWSESWDRKLENIFEIQDEISLLIADKIREQFGHLEIAEHLVEKKTNSLEAYNYWLKARYHFNKWNPDDVSQSIVYYEKSIKYDPLYTDGWGGLADAYGFMATTQFMPPEDAWKNNVRCTQKAYELDPNHAGVHYLLANLSFFTDSNFKESMAHAQKSVELKSSYPEAQQFMAFLFILSGDFEKAKHHLQFALAVDPLNQETLFYKSYLLYRSREIDQALILLDDLLQKNPENIPAFVVKAYGMLLKKEFSELLPIIENASEKTLIKTEKLGILTLLFVLWGEEERAGEYLGLLEKEAENPVAFQAHSYLFLAYANLHKFDAAFDLLEALLKMKSPIILLSFTDPLVNGLVHDKRYWHFHERLYGSKYLYSVETDKKPLLDQEACTVFDAKLMEFMIAEQPYLNPSISLRELAALIEIHPNQLSWLLNEYKGKRFNEFINHHRVMHFIELVKNPENANFSILGLAYESGFNSKTVFNTFFKKEMGLTPAAYLKKLNG